MSLSVCGFTVYLVAYRQSKQSLSQYLSPLANYVISGTIAEFTSSFIWTPMEVLKNRLQISTARSRHPIEVVRQIYRQEGIRGFFQGYWMGIAVFLPHSVVFWVVYENVRKMRSKPSNIDNAVSAATGTVVATCCTNILDVVKTRQQVAFSPDSLRASDKLGVLSIGRRLVKESGFWGAATKGLGVRLSASIPSSALTMMLVEYLHPDTSPSAVPAMDEN